MAINPVSYCLLNRGHWERDIQSVRRDPACRPLKVDCALQPASLATSPSFSQHPPPAAQDSQSLPPFPLCSILATFVSTLIGVGFSRAKLLHVLIQKQIFHDQRACLLLIGVPLVVALGVFHWYPGDFIESCDVFPYLLLV